MKYHLCLILILIIETHTLSSYWTRVLSRICSNNTHQNIKNALLACDQLMDDEAKDIFEDCVKQVNGFEVIPERPKVCYYSRKARQLDNCKSDRYRQRNYNITEIISKEQKHTWCLMKIAKPLGWEHLCGTNLSQNSKSAIRRCDDTFRDITTPITNCYEEVLKLTKDERPAACLSFEHSNELRQCLERYNNDSKRLEQKANGYMDCLKSVDPN